MALIKRESFSGKITSVNEDIRKSESSCAVVGIGNGMAAVEKAVENSLAVPQTHIDCPCGWQLHSQAPRRNESTSTQTLTHSVRSSTVHTSQNVG